MPSLRSRPFLPCGLCARYVRMQYAKHRCDQTRSGEAKLLDDGIDDYFGISRHDNERTFGYRRPAFSPTGWSKPDAAGATPARQSVTWLER